MLIQIFIKENHGIYPILILPFNLINIKHILNL